MAAPVEHNPYQEHWLSLSQFSLRGLFYLTTVVAVSLALRSVLDIWQIILAAGACGFLGFILLSLTSGSPASRKQVIRWTVGSYIVVLLMMGLMPHVGNPSSARTPDSRSTCRNNMRNVVLALLSYTYPRGSFPPAYIADGKGKPMHSWRVLILPNLERPDLKRAYNFNEPWNGPNNRKLESAAILELFCCPRGADPKSRCTNYVAVVGPGTAFPIPNAAKLTDIPDPSNCILLIEWEPTDIHWMEPRDVTIAEALARFRKSKGKLSGHTDGANVAFADGTVRFLDEKTLIKLLEDMLAVEVAKDAKL